MRLRFRMGAYIHTKVSLRGPYSEDDGNILAGRGRGTRVHINPYGNVLVRLHCVQ